ncbi:5-formyltetrahydrofolate cyclo-ligase [Actinomyces sp. ph3]|jgi:5-formyltetrahydrofolate cyclo-ligase|uniref:5-formyltetrahydrofolate cyclo-ligase n=1 Tax=Actinomyces sp. ph3 TaxID=1118058 RepID=UPI0003171B7A|nr:5-formyltetrahydrofolate cyclo-ligase [Actinomyces sp. ph3]
MTMHKNSLRAEIRARRSLYWDSRGRGEEQGERDALTAHFREALDAFGVTPSSSHPLAAFYPMEKEPDISGILACFDPVLLPVLAREDGTLLCEPRWALHSRGDELTRPNPRFPAQSRAPIREAQALEAASVVLIAGLSVDEAGTRLGQGGGWYDRALLYKGVSAPVIACVFDWEYRGKELLPHEDHDIPVDGVITPSHFIKLGIK